MEVSFVEAVTEVDDNDSCEAELLADRFDVEVGVDGCCGFRSSALASAVEMEKDLKHRKKVNCKNI